LVNGLERRNAEWRITTVASVHSPRTAILRVVEKKVETIGLKKWPGIGTNRTKKEL
jgi:hypothetical protein